MAWISSNAYLNTQQQQNNALIVSERLTARGWSKNAIAGLLGNMQSESTINPGIWQSLKYGNYSGGYGLVQWTPATNYTDWATNNGYSITDGDAQLKWIDEETTKTGQWIKTSAYNITFNEFKTSTESPEYLASAFLKNFERAGVEVEENRRTQARTWFEFLGSGTENNSANYYIIENAIEFCIDIANDNTHGYDQEHRWGPDYDCSSLIITAFENAGCPVKTNGASYTGNMESAFVESGFVSIPYSSNMEFIRGDVLWRTGHVEMYIGDNKRVGAHINENGEIVGGQTGDQTGNEISVVSFSPSENWEIVLRLPYSSIPDDPGQTTQTTKKKRYNFLLFNTRRKRIY